MVSTDVTVGMSLRGTAAFTALPVGTTIIHRNNPRTVFTKTDAGVFVDNSGRALGVGEFDLRGGMQVHSLPENPAVVMRESLMRYKWRFRTNAVVGQERHGVSYQAVWEALGQLGCADDVFPLGVGMTLVTTHDKERLPDQSVVSIGHPARYDTYGLFVMKRRRFVPLLGQQLNWGGALTVQQVAGEVVHQDWFDTPGTADDAAAIRDFKIQAYQIGQKVKRAQGWCGTYDHVVAQAEVTRDVLRYQVTVGGARVGMVVNPATAATLPVGTVLRWQSRDYPDTRVCWYMRVVNSRNAAGTRLIFGYRDDSPPTAHYSDRMEIMGFPSTEMNLPVDLARAWQHLPVGTVLYYNNSAYVMCHDHRAIAGTGVRNTGAYNLADFGDLTDAPMTVSSFPVPS